MLTKLERLKIKLPKVYAAYYGEDWKTQGDWLGRMCRHWCVLCGAASPFDHPVYFSDKKYNAQCFIGPNHNSGDTLRRWVHWEQTEDKRALWNPLNGYRRQSEWDDHGEAYYLSKDGPDLWYLLEIKVKGTFRVGMYFVNKDGHAGANRFRDYIISIYPSTYHSTQNLQITSENWHLISQQAELQTRTSTPLTSARIQNFWGGVYKQFIVKGQNSYFVKIDRNYSYNTILSAVMIDRMTGDKLPEELFGLPCMADVEYNPPEFPDHFYDNYGRRLLTLWNSLDAILERKNGINFQRKYKTAIYQAAIEYAQSDQQIAELATSFKWRLNQWDTQQRKEHVRIMKKGFNRLLELTPSLKNSIESQKYGVPDTIKNWER
jgi:hypothetical protein